MADAFGQAIMAIYDAATDIARWPEALESVADCFGAVGTVMLQRHADGRMAGIVSPRLQCGVADYEQNWSHRDLRTIRSYELGLISSEGVLTPEGVLTDRHIITPEEMEREPFYTDFCRKYGVWWYMSSNVSPHPNIAVFLAVQRAREGGPFTDEEMRRFYDLARHAEKSLRLSVRLSEAEASNVGLETALEQLGAATFLLDEAGAATFANEKARSLLGSTFDVVNGELRPSLAEHRAAFSQARRLACDETTFADTGKPILVRGTGSRWPYACYFLPVGKRDPKLSFFNEAAVVLLVLDANSAGRRDRELGANGAETRVRQDGMQPAERTHASAGHAVIVVVSCFGACAGLGACPAPAAYAIRIAVRCQGG